MSNAGNGFVPKENISKNKQTPPVSLPILSPPLSPTAAIIPAPPAAPPPRRPLCAWLSLCNPVCLFVAVQHVAQLHFGP